MHNPPHEEILQSPISKDLETNLSLLKTLLYLPQNQDVVLRRCQCRGFDLCVVYVEGMADDKKISEFILHACKSPDNVYVPEAERISLLISDYIEVAQCDPQSSLKKILAGILGGMTAVVVDGADEMLLMETRGFAHRPVNKPLNESVVMGAQEGFVENLRTNITLVRRYLQSPQLITERYTIGVGIPTAIALIYLDGVVNQDALDEARRRLKSIQSPTVQSIGAIQQLIEDSPRSLFPQMLQTERPDRAASCLTEGQFVILSENAPYALTAPVTLFHLIHSPDDTFLRWQYASFLRIIRIAGILLSLLLPGMYVALTLHHSHIIPFTLLLSIAETRIDVPFSILAEVLVMDFAFYLINEASTRIPSQIGATISIVGALILGQAAVSASIISPMLIIIVALTGLGNFATPNYSFGLSIVLYRITLVLAGGLLGLYGLLAALLLMTLRLCSLHSFGVPYLAPVAPKRPHNPDILLRLSLFRQKKPMYFAQKNNWLYHRRNESPCD
ncbi:MAG: spore germination protein [Christensenellales bacterium]|nr:spore germination protein [Christensenellales bacterium]